jgi:hypothetical protein
MTEQMEAAELAVARDNDDQGAAQDQPCERAAEPAAAQP